MREKILTGMRNSDSYQARGQKISASLKKRFSEDPDFAKAQAATAANARRHITDESHAKRGRSRKGREATADAKNLLLSYAKRPRSDETKRNMSLGRKGIQFSEEHRKNIAAATKRQWQGAGYRALMLEHRKNRKMPMRDTKPERLTQKWLSGHGIPFNKHALLPDVHPRHRFDIEIPHAGLLVEVDGCYFHGCATCGYSKALSNFFDKFSEHVNSKSNAHGYLVVRIWEHEIEDGTGFKKLLTVIRGRESRLLL